MVLMARGQVVPVEAGVEEADVIAPPIIPVLPIFHGLVLVFQFYQDILQILL